MSKKVRLVSLILLAGALISSPEIFAETLPAVQNAGISQQKGKVSGIVEDALGPVIGATVMVKGTTNGTATDMDGKFTLTNVKEGDIIQVSYIGYLPQEIKYTGQPSLQITMKENSQALEEVVVVGYGTQKKANLTGAVSQVAGDVLENRPITNIGQGLQGVVPNLNVTVGSGAPGQSSSFNIRGTTSLNGGGPLILVDNVQMDPNLVNPEDIASISVLKDAASAAIYGARAAYGVILITTKTGKKNQKPQISLNASGYWQSPAVRMHNINSLDYLKMRDLAYTNSGGSGSKATPGQIEMVEAYINGTYPYPEYYDETHEKNKWIYCGNTDWFDELYKTSFSQQYNIGINGGDDKTTYYGSVGFADQTGILKASDDKYRKFNVNLNVNTQITKWLQASAKISHAYTIEDHPTGSSTSGITNYGGMLKNDLSPLMPVYHGHTGRLFRNENASAINDPILGITSTSGFDYVDEGINRYAGQGDYTNPYAVAESGGTTKFKKNDLWMTGALKITPFEGLVINADYTFNFYNNGVQESRKKYYDYKAVAGTEAYYPWTNPSYASYENNEDYYTALNLFAEYSKTFNKDHNFKIMVGYNQEYKHTKYFYATRYNLIDDNTPDIGLASGDQNMNSSESHWGINGYFARLNYNYKQRYLIEFNGRYDGSSKFSKGNRFQFFPSVSGAWRISEEAFWNPLKNWWDDMKIRASYGSLGNQVVDNLGNFPYLTSYGTNSSYGYLIDGKKQVIVTPSGLVSGNFTWETVNQMDFGFDAMFLQNRLSTTFDWYRRNTKDMLVAGQKLPAVLGTSVPNENAANLKTVGWDLSIGWNDRLENGFSYWAKGVLSDYTATITKIDNNPDNFYTSNYVGKKLNEIWGYRSNGLFQTDEEAASAPSQTDIYAGEWKAGDVRYVDLNKNGRIDKGSDTLDDPGDKTIIGNSTPRYQFGITLGFAYKGFDFEMFWQGTGKRDYMVGGGQFWGFTSQWDVPYTPSLDFWVKDDDYFADNTDAYFPRPNWQNDGNRQTCDRYLQSAAYGRLKNLTLGYTIPAAITKKASISKLRVYITGENLITITPLNDAFDPETLGNLTYPINRKVAVGLNLTF